VVPSENEINLDERAQALLRALVDNKVISQAQANLVSSDHEATGMNVEDILLARRWVSEEALDSHAPWLKADNEPDRPVVAGQSYEDNLRKYRLLLAEILGESSE
jgi:hypothetical protein